MAFISSSDYDSTIKAEILTLTQGNEASRQKAEQDAISQVKGYLGGRFDIEYELSLLDAERNDNLIRWIIDISLYRLYNRRGEIEMPPERGVNFDTAIEQLKDARAGNYHTGLKLLDLKGDSNYMKLNPGVRTSSKGTRHF
jgi:phage gp36-like protein